MDLICFSHLRWNFVYQRPQHLLTRFAKKYRVFYLEEPVFENRTNSFFESRTIIDNLQVITPHLPEGLGEKEIVGIQQALLIDIFEEYNIHPNIFWFYTPMALPITKGFSPDLTIYDCMDELSNFKFAPPALKSLEKELFAKADLVFTGGNNLYNAKKHLHKNIWSFPSSIDKDHFAQARMFSKCPDDQSIIPGPRFGYYGVIDERMDLELLRNVAERNKGWQFIMIGPVIKIDRSSLPQLPNIHYLGSRKYENLPAYLQGWHIAMIPFLRNDATRFISPTKTPEYLAAGIPVISTSIVDVVNPYGNEGLVYIADTADDFINAAKEEFEKTDKAQWLQRVDLFLKNNSWNNTWKKMYDLIVQTVENKNKISNPLKKKTYV